MNALDVGLIRLAVLAVGGQGGGVLSGWIAELAALGGYAVQTTSIAGVAQRTGATVYYVEMAPKTGRQPVFAQSPSPGDVDVVIAAELMEAGRALQRGFISADRTTLIASTHRILAVSEKIVPGDGRADAAAVLARVRGAARRALCYDMARIADDAGSVISASLFGALAASSALPFSTTLYEDAIRASGRGVDASLAAFRASLAFADGAGAADAGPSSAAAAPTPTGPARLLARWQQLAGTLDALPAAARSTALLGLRKTVDYQDPDYGAEYLQRLRRIAALDDGRGHELSVAAAKHIANALCYDDILRVADLKTRRGRGARLRREQQTGADDVVRVTEYLHPRAEEFISVLPAGLGARLAASPRAVRLVDRLVNRGRRLRSDRVGGFTLLWLIAGLRPLRRRLLRHRVETVRIDRWLDQVAALVPQRYALAVELLHCQRLIKGYSDTHARGLSRFDRAAAAAETLRSRDDGDAAERLRRLREAALSAADDAAFERALREIV